MKIALVGDVMLGRLVNKVLKNEYCVYPWGDTLPILHSADLRICNLECVISDIGHPWSATPKVFHFRTDEKNVRSLQAAKIDIVSLANNHVLDYEYEALLRMINLLDDHKILHAGSGRNLNEALKMAVYHLEGEKIGFLAFTDNEPGWGAEQNKPGVFYIPINIKCKQAQELFQQIKKLREEVDFLIISAHWGPNWGYDPPEEHISFAHALVDAGADLIFGHSGHVFRGIEIYQDRPIIYCAGDFIDDYAVDEVEKNDESFIYVVEREAGQKMKIYLYPVCIDQFQVNLAISYRKDAILSKMDNLCKKLGTRIHRMPEYAILDI